MPVPGKKAGTGGGARSKRRGSPRGEARARVIEHEAPPLRARRSVDECRASYVLQRARYEKTAVAVAEKLALHLRSESIRYLLSFRSKHPDDVAEKLVRKRESAKYGAIGEDLNLVMTDLAGVRVVVYDPRDEAKVAAVVRRHFKLAEQHPPDERDSEKPPAAQRGLADGYRATHLLVLAPDGPEHSSVAGAVCEVQVCNVAAHLFNEVEHDISYKWKKASPTGKTRDALEALRRKVRELEAAALETFKRHEHDAQQQSTELLDADDLLGGLQKAADGSLSGDFRSLFVLLSAVMSPLTVQTIRKVGGKSIPLLISSGRTAGSGLGIGSLDDATALAVALEPSYREEFVRQAEEWEGSRPRLVKTILKLAERRRGAER